MPQCGCTARSRILLILLLPIVLLIAFRARADMGKPSDPQITRAVETDLLRNKSVPSQWIDVKSDDGIVTLSGSVDNLLAKERAVASARSVKGVRAVIDRLKVKTESRPDIKIQTDVIQALAVDPATDAFEVAAEVDDGVVTLSGKVSSWVEKELAAKVAKGIRGVVDVKNEIAARFDSERNDSEIASDIRARLRWDPRIDDDLITVEVKDGKVSLTGVAGSAAEKHFAYADAWIAGVNQVDMSRLKVEPSAREKMRRGHQCAERSSEELRLAVINALVADPRVSVFNPTVEVENFTVVLTGVVDNYKAKSAAAMDAKNTACIVRVKNFLKVRPFKILPDQTIADEVRAALERDPDVSREEVKVSVSNGLVFLSGEVDTLYDVTQAEDLASRIPGVVEVRNNLTVHDIVNTKTDYEIKEDIEDQLWWSPFLDSDSVKVEVQDEVATLTGSVGSRWEYETAASNALEGGARKVVNRLQITGIPGFGGV